MAFQDIIYTLDRIGFTDIFLPFILIFTIVFATLQKMEIFGKDLKQNKKFNAIISMALAIGVIIPHSLGRYPPGTDVVQILNDALPGISLVIIAIVFFLILINTFGVGFKTDGFMSTIVTVVSFVFIIFIFGQAAGWWQPYRLLYWLQNSDMVYTILIIATFWIIIAVMFGESTPTPPAEPQKPKEGGSP